MVMSPWHAFLAHPVVRSPVVCVCDTLQVIGCATSTVPSTRSCTLCVLAEPHQQYHQPGPVRSVQRDVPTYLLASGHVPLASSISRSPPSSAAAAAAAATVDLQGGSKSKLSTLLRCLFTT